jgi:uncharacterized membrane protein
MARYLALVVVALVTIVALDALWLGVLMRRFYSTRFAPIGRMSGGAMAPIWPAAAGVYVLLSIGIVAFALPQAGGAVAPAAAWGGLLGGVIYGFYNLTNHATLAGWSPAITVVDIGWGTGLCAAVTTVVTIAERWTA